MSDVLRAASPRWQVVLADELRRFARATRRSGVAHALRILRDRVEDRIAERRLGFHSAGLIPIETLIPQWRDCHDYFPSTFSHFRLLLDALAIGPHDVFVDYGAGKGRTLAVAAEYPFKRVIGVEIAPALVAAARVNLARAVPAARLHAVEMWEGNAADYRLPDDATVTYIYNPFHGSVLRAVLADIRRSLDDAPRRMTVVINNPRHFGPIANEYPWLRCVRVFQFEYECLVHEAEAA
ncbi:MAG: histone methylation family protein [Candidatus Eremiobacteraeota bacterium]|nr:histone methylation family protein [Candidatus Eremiobacteraeota bacterium]